MGTLKSRGMIRLGMRECLRTSIDATAALARQLSWAGLVVLLLCLLQLLQLQQLSLFVAVLATPGPPVHQTILEGELNDGTQWQKRGGHACRQDMRPILV